MSASGVTPSFVSVHSKQRKTWFGSYQLLSWLKLGQTVKEGPVTMSLPPAVSALLLPLGESVPQSDTHNFLNLTHTTFSI